MGEMRTVEADKMVLPVLVALSVVAEAITVMTVWAELDHGFKEWVAFPGHHWVGKGIVAIAVFVVGFAVALLIPRLRGVRKSVQAPTIVALVVLGLSIVAITVFYVLHYLEG